MEKANNIWTLLDTYLNSELWPCLCVYRKNDTLLLWDQRDTVLKNNMIQLELQTDFFPGEGGAWKEWNCPRVTSEEFPIFYHSLHFARKSVGNSLLILAELMYLRAERTAKEGCALVWDIGRVQFHVHQEKKCVFQYQYMPQGAASSCHFPVVYTRIVQLLEK